MGTIFTWMVVGWEVYYPTSCVRGLTRLNWILENGSWILGDFVVIIAERGVLIWNWIDGKMWSNQLEIS